jgi:hypothetical protein
MKKIFLTISLIFPMLAQAECSTCKKDSFWDFNWFKSTSSSKTEDPGFPDESISSFNEYSYIGLKSGKSTYPVNISAIKPNSFGVMIGYRSGKNTGYEAEYTSFGNYKNETSSGKATAMSFSGLGYINPLNRLALYGRLGVASTQAVDTLDYRKRAFNVLVGVGASFGVNQDFLIRTEISQYKINMPDMVNVKNMHASLIYKY